MKAFVKSVISNTVEFVKEFLSFIPEAIVYVGLGYLFLGLVGYGMYLLGWIYVY